MEMRHIVVSIGAGKIIIRLKITCILTCAPERMTVSLFKVSPSYSAVGLWQVTEIQLGGMHDSLPL